jgi:hypothetical protein
MRQTRMWLLSAQEAYKASALHQRLQKTFTRLNQLKAQSTCSDEDEALLESFLKLSSVARNV